MLSAKNYAFDGLWAEDLQVSSTGEDRSLRRSTGRLYYLENLHPALAMRTDTDLPSLVLADLHIGLLLALLGHRRTAKLDLHLTYLVTIGRRKQSIMTDTDKGRWQDVEREEMQEIHSMHLHRLVPAGIAVVLPVVCNHTVSRNILDAGIADGYAIGVAADVLKHLADALCRRTAEDHPSLGEAGLAHVLWYDNILLLQGMGKHCHHLGTEDLAESLHGKEEFLRLPASLQVMPDAILVHTAASDDAVDVRMIEEV